MVLKMKKITVWILLAVCMALLCCPAFASENETEIADDFQPIGIGETTSSVKPSSSSQQQDKLDDSNAFDSGSETSIQLEQPKTDKEGKKAKKTDQKDAKASQTGQQNTTGSAASGTGGAQTSGASSEATQQSTAAEPSEAPSEAEALPMMTDASTPVPETQADTSAAPVTAQEKQGGAAWLAAPILLAALAAGALYWWRRRRGA